MIELQGISWDHPRGHDPMVATARAYSADDPEVRIAWRPRSLQDFADFPIEQLAERADLLLIDHPFMGFASASGCLLPLDEYLEPGFLRDQAENSVGPSHQSYAYGGHQWALAIDAACQVCGYRPDLMEEIGATLPSSWDAVLELAISQSSSNRAQVAIPLIPVDTLMSFLSICANLGDPPFRSPDRVVGSDVGREAWTILSRLRDHSHAASMQWNPIKTLDRMSETDEIAYVPLIFGYSNYGRPGFRRHVVLFTGVLGPAGNSNGGILGGVGLAVSSRTNHRAEAVDYARFVASGAIQRGLFFEAGGQPGHRTAWTDAAVNEVSNGYFANTLDAIDHAYLRPRFHGFLQLQDGVGRLLHDALKAGASADSTLEELDELYRSSQPPAVSKAK